MMRRWMLLLSLAGLLWPAGPAPGGAEDSAPQPGGVLYVVATSHLDTQWRWTIQTTISEYLPATLRDNFALIEKYPGYVFSFEGAFRYQLMKEYYPAEYERLKDYVAAGRWRVAGSWLDAVDVNVPSPESLVRHALYGNGFFRRELGVTSRDVYLPDCFGFGFALPTVAAHCGLSAFSTQKLTWGSAVGVPFDVGLWEGVDGSTLVAALNPGQYVSEIESDLSADPEWIATVRRQGELSGLYAGFKYFGTGDQGGAPTEASVAWLEKSLAGSGPLAVRSVAPDQLARELDPARRARLPRYRGELLMTRHGVGCYTSQAAMKRWNRHNELLAEAAERAAVVADWLGAAPYPRETLRAAWTRFLWHQFHDDLTGTSIPEAYVFSWNDEIVSLNQFAAVLTDAVGAVSRVLDTRAEGIPLVVYNPLGKTREDLVAATIEVPGPPAYLRVFGPDGREVPAQSRRRPDGTFEVVFPARVPGIGFAVYDVRPSAAPCALETGLSGSADAIENERYRVRFRDFEVVSIFDKRAGRELLSAPLHLQMLGDEPERWAAWEIDYEDLTAAPIPVGPGGAPQVVEEGPARVSVLLRGRGGGSTFAQRVSLAAGEAGNRVEVELDVDWRTPATLLKAAFPLAISDQQATYDLGLGPIRRGTNTPKLYEVPAQRWADLTAADDGYGVAVLNDGRYGWDKPDDHTLRLTLVRTPAVNDRWRWIDDQKSQDLGRHRVRYAVVGHAGDWRRAPGHADRFNQPLRAFRVPAHDGPLGRSFSLLAATGRSTRPHTPTAPPEVGVLAVKKAEESDEIVVRLVSLAGRDAEPVTVRFVRPLVSAREVNGAEEPVGEATLRKGALEVSLRPYQPRAFAVRLGEPPVRLEPPRTRPLELPYDHDGISRDDDPTDGDFDGAGHTLAGELLPAELMREGIPFRTGDERPGKANVVVCRGQRLALPEGDFDRLYLLAAAVGGGRRAAFAIDGEVVELWVQDYATPIGQWDSRLSGGKVYHEPDAIVPGYVNRAPVGWVGTHRHGPAGENEPYVLTYLFKYGLDLPAGARTLTLPDDPGLRIVAITAARNPNDVAHPAWPLYDRYDGTTVEILAERREFLDAVEVALRSPNPDPIIRYTLDGTDPVPSSPVYREPFTITERTTVKARTWSPGMDPGYVARVDFVPLTARPPASVADVRPGLRCRYHEGAWEKLPDFAALKPLRTEVVDRVAVPEFARAEDVGIELSGFIAVPQRGVYRLGLRSDDGSALYLDGERVVDNDGIHGATDVWVDVALDPGRHRIRVEYFQHLGGRELELWWEGPGIPRQAVPSEVLFLEAEGEDRSGKA